MMMMMMMMMYGTLQGSIWVRDEQDGPVLVSSGLTEVSAGKVEGRGGACGPDVGSIGQCVET